MSRFLSKRHFALEPYTPGEQPCGTFIKLNTNESPYPPPEQLLRHMRDFDFARLRLYPDPECTELCSVLAELHGIEQNQILPANGSDELLAFFFHAFCEADVCFPDITYGFYKVYASLFGARAITPELSDDFTVNVAAYMGVNAPIVLANPNAPTGLALCLTDIESILCANRDYPVLIDEAYVDFGAQTVLELVNRYDNLVVLRTFSKSMNLAGARLGYAIGSVPIIDDLKRIKYSFNPYNVNMLTQHMGVLAVSAMDYYERCRAEIIKTRGQVISELRGLGFDVTNSLANFVFARHPRIGGMTLQAGLRDGGVLVRRFDDPRISDYLRITIGTPDEMRRCLELLSYALK